MRVVATAGHVDHGKSTLVRALTGMEPDRWAEERRRGMTIDLGFAWTDLPDGATVAFVDVPGHQRFIANMLAGVGPAPAVLFVVAADEGWSQQSAEHLAALDALGVEHGLLAITRCDLADPLAAQEESLAHISRTSLGTVPCIAVSPVTGAGIDDLRRALMQLVRQLPAPQPTERVRLWVDRSFTIRGAGTVVTGTLQAGALTVGERLALASTGELVRVRGIESLGVAQDAASAVARVAVNVSGPVDAIGRGDALVTQQHWRSATEIDVRLTGQKTGDRLPRQLILHIGTADVAVQVRPLGADAARLTLQRPLPLQNGDRGALRDPGRQQIAAGVRILDAAPPPLGRRGGAAARADALVAYDGPDASAETIRRGVVSAQLLVELGCATVPADAEVRRCGDWFISPTTWQRWREALRTEVERVHAQHPLAPGLAADAAVRAVGVPDRAVLQAVAAEVEDVALSGGFLSRRGWTAPLPTAVGQLLERLDAAPYEPPTAVELQSAGLTPGVLAAAARAGAVVRLRDDVVLTPAAIHAAEEAFGRLPQPFTLAAARDALTSSRRVTLALLDHLDSLGRTTCDPQLRRTIR